MYLYCEMNMEHNKKINVQRAPQQVLAVKISPSKCVLLAENLGRMQSKERALEMKFSH